MDYLTGYYIGYLIGGIIWGIIWGVATNAIIHNKGYDENWFWWGFFFSFIAVIVAISKPENRNRYTYQDSSPSFGNITSSGYSFGSAERIASNEKTLSSGGWRCYCGRVNASYVGTCACGRTKSENEAMSKSGYVSSAPVREEKPLANGEWRCTCGRVNPSYVGTCACGKSRYDIDKTEKATKPVEGKDKKENDEMSNLSAIRELKALLDEGAITQEEFDLKKKQLLGI